jgi:hypothetical protein
MCAKGEREVDDVAYVTIPPEHVEQVTLTLLGAYSARAEALGASALAVLDGAEDAAELEHARRELQVVEDALTDLGWPDAPPGGAVEIVGPSLLLRDVVRTALVDASDGVVEALRRYEAARDELPPVRRAVEAVSALFELFASFEAGRAPALDSEV